MPYCTSNDGVRLFYDDIGQGRPLVLIHGWTFSGRFFHRNVCALASHALLPLLDVPALVLVARQDSTFPWQGPAWVGEHMPNAQTVFFEESSHMLFHDEPEKFNATIVNFLQQSGERVGAAIGDR